MLRHLAILLLLLAGSAACAATPHARIGSQPAPRTGGRAALPGEPVSERPARPQPSTGAVGGAESEVVCRASSGRQGWVIVDYVTLSGCGTSDANHAPTGAVIARIDNRPIGSVIAVCADQQVPSQWMRERADIETKACRPDDRSDRDVPYAVMIRRVR